MLPLPASNQCLTKGLQLIHERNEESLLFVGIHNSCTLYSDKPVPYNESEVRSTSRLSYCNCQSFIFLALIVGVGNNRAWQGPDNYTQSQGGVSSGGSWLLVQKRPRHMFVFFHRQRDPAHWNRKRCCWYSDSALLCQSVLNSYWFLHTSLLFSERLVALRLILLHCDIQGPKIQAKGEI